MASTVQPPSQFLSQLLSQSLPAGAREWVKEATARLWAIGLEGEMRPTAVVAAITPFVAAGVALLVALHPLVPIDVRSLRLARPGPAVVRCPAAVRAALRPVVAVRECHIIIVDGVETAAGDRVDGPRHLDLRRVEDVVLSGGAAVVFVAYAADRPRLGGGAPLRPLLRLHVQGEAAASAGTTTRNWRNSPSTCGRRARRVGGGTFEGRAKCLYLRGLWAVGRDWPCGAAVRTLMARIPAAADFSQPEAPKTRDRLSQL